jgi:PAS domain S-box-containing protein
MEIDLEGKFIYSNQVVENILGYLAEEIIGRKYYDSVHQSAKENGGNFYKSLIIQIKAALPDIAA